MMDAKLRQFVRHRARNLCEYCRIRQSQEPLPFHIEHVIPRKHDGKDVAENLALACHHCNLHKGTNLSGFDPKTGKMSRLFHPRLDDWNEHFTDDNGEIFGRSVIGRTTVN
jgi:hypothetical protein